MLCYIIWYYIVLYYVALCYVILYYAIPYHIIILYDNVNRQCRSFKKQLLWKQCFVNRTLLSRIQLCTDSVGCLRWRVIRLTCYRYDFSYILVACMTISQSACAFVCVCMCACVCVCVCMWARFWISWCFIASVCIIQTIIILAIWSPQHDPPHLHSNGKHRCFNMDRWSKSCMAGEM